MDLCHVKKTAGFTLIELIFVVVILGLLAAIGSSFLATTLDMYNDTSERVAVMQRGRVAIEQMSRYLRSALPNAVRVSASGKCIEFLPVVSGGNYLTTMPDSQNGAAAISNTTTSPFYITNGNARYFVVAPLATADVYTASTTSAIVAISSVTGTPYTGINFSAAHIFLRNSVSSRFFITDYPLRFCFSGTQLLRYRNYGLATSALGDTDPGGSSDIMADNIVLANSLFSLSPGSEERNTSIGIRMAIKKNKTSLTLNHKVLVRNVP